LNNLKIRKATIDDLQLITDLILLCSEKFILPEFNIEGRKSYLESHSLEKMSERIQSFVYQIAVDLDRNVVGVVGIQNESHLFHLHVHPSLQGRGLGKTLWEAAKKLALQTKPQKFTVNSSRFAIPFYQNLGFLLKSEENKSGVIYFPMVMELDNQQ
jgi:N-acetylglutamate synthase-like GNAT family acetyltransferase